MVKITLEGSKAATIEVTATASSDQVLTKKVKLCGANEEGWEHGW